MRRPLRRGSGLASVLILAALALTLVFAVASSAIAHLALTTRREQVIRARHAAESAIAEAVSLIHAQKRFTTLTVRNNGTTGTTTVDQSVAGHLRMPWSTDNRDSSLGVLGDLGRRVPPFSVHLIARGEAGDVRETVECILTLGDLPFVVGSQGAVQSDGGMLIAAVNSADALISLSAADLLPGHLVSNSDRAAGVQLGPSSHVTGDVRSSGGVRLSRDVTVDGFVLSNQAAVNLPAVDPRPFDPRDQATPISSTTGDLNLEGFIRSRGDLTVGGDLRLANSVLYVDGNLHVEGRIEGRGALLVAGSIVTQQGTRLAAADRMAVLASGDIQLNSRRSGDADFAGLMATAGQLEAFNLTLAGVFVSKGGGAVGMDLHSVRMIGLPGSGRVRLDVAMSPLNGNNPAAVPLLVPMDIEGVPGYGTNTSGSNNVFFYDRDWYDRTQNDTSSFKIPIRIYQQGDDILFDVMHPGTGHWTTGLRRGEAVMELRSTAISYGSQLTGVALGTVESQWQEDSGNVQGLLNGRHLFEFIRDGEAQAAARSKLVKDRPRWGTPIPPRTIPFEIDLSTFLDPADTTKIMLWRSI